MSSFTKRLRHGNRMFTATIPSQTAAGVDALHDHDKELFTPLEQLNAEAVGIIYSPIGEDEIRFVKVHPGRRSDPLRCSLVTSNRSAAPRYDALSYEWGSQKNPSSILLDDQKFRITLNLERALLRLRQRRTPRLVWIDALVINQSDTAERGAQVQQMAHTYQSASTVFVWLGEGNKDVLRFLNWAIKVGKVMPFIKWLPILHGYFDRFDDGLALLAALTYWSRTWVFQEFLFAKRPVLIYDYDHFDFLILVQVIVHGFSHWGNDRSLMWLPDTDNISQSFAAASQQMRLGQFIDHRQVIIWFSEIDFIEWVDDIVILGASKSSNPLDQVYGVHSLFPPEIRQQIPIDYNISVTELYSLVTRLVVEHSGNLVILGIVPARRRLQSNLPSWVLDLTGENHFTEVSIHFKENVRKLQDQGVPAFYAFEANSILHVKGRNLGTLKRLASTLDSNIHFSGCTDLEASVFVSEQVTEHWKRLLDQLEFDESELASVYKSFSFMPHIPKLPGTYNVPDVEAHELEFRVVEAKHVKAKKVKSNTRIKLPEVATWPNKLAAASILHFHTQHIAFSILVSEIDSKEGEVKSILGFSTSEVEVGDTIASILGCNAVLVLRSEGDHDIIVGTAMVPGFNEMEAIKGLEPSSELLRDYFLE